MELMAHRTVGGDRVVLSGATDRFDSFTHGLQCPSPHFVLFLAANTRGKDKSALLAAAKTLVRAGASYVCCWGPDCERLHDCFDEADIAVNGDGTDERVLMTTSHEGEPLEEALWFAVHAAWPTPDYEVTTGAVVAVSIGHADWSDQIRAYLTAGAPLIEEV